MMLWVEFNWKSLSMKQKLVTRFRSNRVACKNINDQKVERKHNTINGLTDDQLVKEFDGACFEWNKLREGMKHSDIYGKS